MRHWIRAALAGCLLVAPPALAGPTRALEVIDVPQAPPDGRKVALVVGNGAYTHATQLGQAPEDATLVARTLGDLGFEVQTAQNVDFRTLSREIAAFGKRAQGASASFFYYAGHAIQVAGANYLVPVDAKLSDPAYVDADAVNVAKIEQALRNSRAPIAVLVLDACRDNPFASSWTGQSRSAGAHGLAQMTGSGILLAYATNPGNVAQDSGVYAQALTRALTLPCVSVTDAFAAVRDDVLRATDGHQEPWIGGSMGVAFSRYQPAGCDGQPSQLPLVPPVPAPRATAHPELDTLEATLARAKQLYERRCVTDLGPVSTASERKDCHARYHPQVQEAQDALDTYLLDHPEVAVP